MTEQNTTQQSSPEQGDTKPASDSTQEPRLHDETYRKLFEHPVLLQELVRYFVGEELGVLADELDFEQMRPSKEAFITDSLARFESDLMCEIPFREVEGEETPREPLYVCVLVEFQSKVDWTMPLRVLNYIVLFYLHLATVQPQKLRDRALPPVLPIVLYNGKQRWNAPLSVEELIAASPKHPLSAHTPKLSLKLVDASHIDRFSLDRCPARSLARGETASPSTPALA